MKTAREALTTHLEGFYQVEPTMRAMDLYTAAECQLRAYAIRQLDNPTRHELRTAAHYDWQARQYMGVN